MRIQAWLALAAAAALSASACTDNEIRPFSDAGLSDVIFENGAGGGAAGQADAAGHAGVGGETGGSGPSDAGQEIRDAGTDGNIEAPND